MAAPLGTIAADPSDPPLAPSESPTASTDPTPSADPGNDPFASPDPTATPDPTPDPTPSADPSAASSVAPYVITFRAGTSSAEQAATIAASGASDLDAIVALRMHAVQATDAAVVALRADARVASVELDRSRAAEAAPDDASYPDQWALPRIGWDQAYGSVAPAGSAIVAVLDTGVDSGHPDLDGNLVTGASFVAGSAWDVDANGHGTAMAGIVAAETGNGIGTAGVGYAGVRVMPVTVLGPNGLGRDSDIIEGLVWATDHGANVALLAFSASGYSAALQAAVDYAWGHGVVVVAATGNDGVSTATFPAGDRGVVGVSSTDRSDALAASSNAGASVFLAAPGEGIVTTAAGGGTVTVSGTSAAAAHVAGAAALLRAADPTATNGVLVNRLAESADAAGTANETGNGRLNLARALGDSSNAAIEPAGVAPSGDGGPFVGPYIAAARNLLLTFAGTGSGTVQVTPNTGTVNAPAACGGTNSPAATQTVAATCLPNITTSDNGATVTFQATTAIGSTFAGWSTASNLSSSTCTGTTNPCSAVLSSNPALTVTFTAATNAAPAVHPANTAVSVDEGATATNSGTWSDSNLGDTVTLSASVGTVVKSGTNATGTWSWSFVTTDGPANSQTVTITADDGTTTTSTTFSLTVRNIAPTVLIVGAPATSPEGTAVNLTSSVSDVAADPAFVYNWAVTKDGSPFASGAAATFSFSPNDNGAYVVSLTATDKDGGVGTAPTKTITVTNVAPTATFTASASVNEGSAIGLSLTLPSDPSSVDTSTGFTYAFDCGDGAGYGPFSGAATASCPTTDSGSRTVRGRIRDKDLDSTEYTATVSVANVAPAVTITGAPASSPEGTPINLGSTVVDPSSDDQTAGFTYSWSVTKNGSPFASGTDATIAFTPDDNGTYVVGLSATDQDGGAGTATAVTITVTNISPTAMIDASSPINEGSASTVSLSAPVDPSTVDAAALHYSFACDGLTSSLAATYAAAGTTASTTCPFDDDGSFTVRARLFDKDGGSNDYAATVQADNRAPTGTFTPSTPIAEGSSSTLTWTSPSDPSPVDAASLHFKFACSPLLSALDPVSYATGSTTNSASCSFADNGSFGVEGAIIDKDNGSIVSGGTVVVANVAPTVTAAANQTADEGVSTSFSLGSFSDPGVLDAPWIIDVQWGDGGSTVSATSTQGALASLSHTYPDNGSYTVTVTVTDKDGDPGVAKFDVVVANVDPTALITGAPLTSFEGTLINLGAAGSDVPADVSAGFTYAWSVTKNGSAFASGDANTFSFTPDDDGTYVVTLALTDKDGGTGHAPERTILGTNVDPAVASLTADPSRIGEGDSTSLSGTFTDPGTLDTHTVTIDWGDGSTDTVLSLGAGVLSFSGATHQYLDDDPTGTVKDLSTVTVTVADDDGGADTDTASVTVDNVPPSDVTAALADSDIDEGETASLSGTFTDPGTLDSHTVTIDWADGSAPQVLTLALGARSYSASHLYVDDDPTNTPSDFPVIHVTVTDDDLGVGATTTTIAVHDVAPTVVVSGPSEVEEGTSATYEVHTTDPGANDTFSLVDWSCGDLGDLTVVVPVDSVTGDGRFSCYFADDDPSGTLVDPTHITVHITDDDTLEGFDDQLVSVLNVDPVADAGLDQIVNEGDVVNLSATVTDQGPNDTFPGTGWHVVAANGQVVPDGSTTSFSFTPNDNGTYTVTFSVSDDDGGSDTDTVVVTVLNVKPTVSVTGAPATSAEGTAITLGSTISDPSSVDTAAGFTTSWTVTKDGSPFASGSASGITFTPDDNGTYVASFSATDKDGGTGTTSATITVTNVNPTVTIDSGAPSVNEGDAATTYTYHWTDPGSADTWTRVTSCGASGVRTDASFDTTAKTGSFTCAWADDNPTATPSDVETVSVTVSDDDLGSDAKTRAVAVSDVGAVVTPGPIGWDPFTHVASVNVAFTDAGKPDTHTATVKWTVNGLAGIPTPVALTESNGAGSFSSSIPLGPGCYTVRADVSVTDDDTLTGTNSSTGSALDAYDVQFRAPIKDDVRNIAKAGSTIPVKLVINKFCGGTGTYTGVDLYLAIAAGATAADVADPDLNVIQDAGSSNDNGLKFRIADGGYIYNFSTKGLSNNSDYTLRVRLGSSTGPIIKTAVIRTQK